MTKREQYIIHKRGRASAFRDAAAYVPASAGVAGLSVRETLVRYAEVSDEAADRAETLTNAQFRNEEH